MKLVSWMRRYLGVNVLRVLQRDLGGAASLPCGRPNLECRVLGEYEALAHALDPQLELRQEWVRNAYAQGGVCLGALEDGRLLGYTWLAYGDTRYTGGVWVQLGARFRYSYKSFVRPECRGQRIAQALHALADQSELRRGRCFAMNLVELDNCSSFAALQRAGSRSIGYAGYAKCFGLLLTFRTPGVARAEIRFYRPTRARIAARMRAWQLPHQGTLG